MDFGQMFAGAEKSVSDTWGTITSTGVPAVLAGIEQYGANQLNSMAKDDASQAQTAAQNMMQNGQPAPGVLGAIQNMFKSTFTGAAAKQYGTWAIIGVAALVGVGYLLAKE